MWLHDQIEEASAACLAEPSGMFDDESPITEADEMSIRLAIEKLETRRRTLEGELARRELLRGLSVSS